MIVDLFEEGVALEKGVLEITVRFISPFEFIKQGLGYAPPTVNDKEYENED